MEYCRSISSNSQFLAHIWKLTICTTSVKCEKIKHKQNLLDFPQLSSSHLYTTGCVKNNSNLMVVKPICFQNMPYTPGCRLFFSGGTVILAHWSCPTLHKGQCDSLALSCTLKYALMLRIVMFSCWYFYPNKMQSFKRECCLLLLKECPDIKIFLRASPVFLKIKDSASCPQGDVK